VANDKVIKLSGWPKGLFSKRENPFDFPQDALVYGENVDLVDGCLKTRQGTTVMSAASLPSGEVMALYQVRFPTNEITYIIAQVDTGTARSIYACPTALPTVSGVFTEIYTLGPTAGVITMAVLNDRVVFTEGVASVPLVWGGAMVASPAVTDWMYPKQVIVSIDGVTFYDITGYVCDNDSLVSAGIGSITANGYLAICTDMPNVEGFYVEMDGVNTGVSGDFTEAMNFDSIGVWNRQDLKGTITNWVQDSAGLTGHFTDGANPVTIGAGNTEADVILGVMVKFSDAECYIGVITNNGEGADEVELDVAHVDAAVTGIYALENVTGSVGLTHYLGALSYSSIWSMVVDSQFTTSSISYRIIIAAGSTSAGADGVRVTITAGSGGTLVVLHASIIERSSVANGTTVPTELKFSGLSGFTLAASNSIVSDDLVFAIDDTKDYLVIVDAYKSIGNNYCAMKTSGGDGVYYKVGVQTWDQQTVSSFTSLPNYTVGVVKIEAVVYATGEYPTGLYTVTNQTSIQQDTTAWTAIKSVVVNQSEQGTNGNVYHAVSFDAGSNYKVFV